MRKAILIFFITCFPFVSLCQNSYRDTLNNLMANEEDKKSFLKQKVNSVNDKVKLAIIFNQLGLQYQYSGQFDSALTCHHIALNHAIGHDRINQEIGVSYNKIGIVHYYKGSADSAYFYIKKGVPFFEEPIAKANALNNLALMCKFRKEPDEAIKNYLQALKIYQLHKDTVNQINLFNNIGSLHFNLEEDSIAEGYFDNALELSEAIKNSNLIFDSKTNLANIYFNKKDYDEAIKIHKEAIEFFRHENNIQSVIINQNNLANIYSEQGYDNKALNIYLEAIGLMEENEIFISKEALLLNIASIYHEKKNYDKALGYYYQSLNFAKENELVYRYVPIYEGLSAIYKDLDNIDSSLYYKNLHIILKDSLDAVEKEKKMMEIKAEHDTKELSTDLAKTKGALDETERRRSMITKGLVVSLIILILVTVGVFFIYRRYKKNKLLSDVLMEANERKDKNITTLSKSLNEKNQTLKKIVKEKDRVKLPYPENLEPLTEREKEVLLGVKEGLKDKEIASKLFISITTVRTHLRKAYVKIDARNRAEAIQFISIHEI